MERLKASYYFVMVLIIQFIPFLALASEGLDVPEELEHKVNLVNLSGIELFFAKTYNDNLWLYAVICTVLMAVVGVGIGYLADLVLKAFGMEVEKIEHKE